MGRVLCEITTNANYNGAKSDGFTVEVRSKEGKIYQKKTSFMGVPFLPTLPPGLTYDKSILNAKREEEAAEVTICVNYGDVITATRGAGCVWLKDENSTEWGKIYSLSVKPNPTDSREKKSVTVTKESVKKEQIKPYVPDPKAPKYRPSTSVWDG